MNKNIDYLLNKFIKYDKIQGECTYNGDYRKGNMASKKLFKIKKLIKNDDTLCKDIIDKLICSDEINVLIWICGIAIEVNYKKDKAEAILTDISENKKNGILGANAEMILKIQNGDW